VTVATTNGGAGAKAPAPTGHSRFGASGADRWIECPGSVKAQEGKPDKTTIYAAEGTAGHEVAALCLRDGHDAIEFTGRHFAVEGFDIEFDEELSEAVQLYLDVIRQDKSKHGGKIVIERRFHLDWLDPEFFGTADCGLTASDGVLRVYDLKLGKGKAVEVEGNRQLSYYALGMIASLPKTLQFDEVELVIVQPRRAHKDGPVRRWRTTPVELLEYTQDLKEAANNARSAAPAFKAGEHCNFCRAAGTCPMLRDKVMAEANADFDNVAYYGREALPEPGELSPEEVAKLLNVAGTIGDWVNAVYNHAEALANEGKKIPGWKLADKRATRKWREEDTKTATELCFNFGLDESSIFSQKLKSPAQIEKLLPKKDREALGSLVSKVSSGTKLVRDDDVRPERPPANDVQTFSEVADAYKW
jgi:hypothetical protein